MNKQPVSYLQTDPRWAAADYSAPGEKTTIGASGCGPTAMAMVLATWADPTVTPKTECDWAKRNGYKAPRQGTYYGYFEPAGKRYGLKVTRLNWANIYGNNGAVYHKQAAEAVQRGDLVIACMGKGNWTSSGHYVLVWDIRGDTIYINDPASTRAARTQGSYSLFKKQVKYYWVIKKTEAVKEEDDMTKEEVKKIVNEVLAEQKTVVYNSVLACPEWAQPTVQKLVDRKVLQGTGTGLGLDYATLRVLVVNDRAGLYD